MKTIRMNTFETNSSSAHALIICNNSDLKKFKEGKLFLRQVDTSRIWHDEPTLITLETAYQLYQERRESDKLPELTIMAFNELMLDPPNIKDYKYPSPVDPGYNTGYVTWDFSKKNYSDETLKQLESYHDNDLAWVFQSFEFPKSYKQLLELTDEDERSEKKANVLEFTVWN